MSESSSLPVFREEDFASLAHRVFAFNSTTETELNSSEEIEVIEFLERGVVVKIPDRFCHYGHNVVLYIFEKGKDSSPENFTEAKGRKDVFGATGKVVQYEKLPSDSLCAAKINFFQFAEEDWAKIRSLYKGRQGVVDQMMKKVRA